MTSERNERIARAFHEAYERLAPEHDYKTRDRSAVPWEDVPADNKGLMIATVGAVLDGHLDDLIADRIVKVLSRALAADPKAITALINQRVPCNEALGDDETIQVGQDPSGGLKVGLLGVLGGLAGSYGADEVTDQWVGWSRVMATHQLECSVHGQTEDHRGRVLGQSCGYNGCELPLNLGIVESISRSKPDFL